MRALPGHDPCRRDPYGCSENDLHAIASYWEVQRRIEKSGHSSRGDRHDSAHTDEAQNDKKDQAGKGGGRRT